MAVVYSKVLLFDPPLIYTAPDTCVFGAVVPVELEHVAVATTKENGHLFFSLTPVSMALAITNTPNPTLVKLLVRYTADSSIQ